MAERAHLFDCSGIALLLLLAHTTTATAQTSREESGGSGVSMRRLKIRVCLEEFVAGPVTHPAFARR